MLPHHTPCPLGADQEIARGRRAILEVDGDSVANFFYLEQALSKLNRQVLDQPVSQLLTICADDLAGLITGHADPHPRTSDVVKYKLCWQVQRMKVAILVDRSQFFGHVRLEIFQRLSEQRESPALGPRVAVGIALEDLEGDVVLLQLMSKGETAHARPDNEHVRGSAVSHDVRSSWKPVCKVLGSE